jgi:hypothetical protein
MRGLSRIFMLLLGTHKFPFSQGMEYLAISGYQGFFLYA